METIDLTKRKLESNMQLWQIDFLKEKSAEQSQSQRIEHITQTGTTCPSWPFFPLCIKAENMREYFWGIRAWEAKIGRIKSL